jgi:hypothetical protein
MYQSTIWNWLIRGQDQIQIMQPVFYGLSPTEGSDRDTVGDILNNPAKPWTGCRRSSTAVGAEPALPPLTAQRLPGQP